MCMKLLHASIACALAALLGACDERPPLLFEGDADNGRLLLRQFGCGRCHVIPGVAAAEGRVGPPLSGVARRAYLAGLLPNTPQNLARWIRDPQSVDPRTAMPDLSVSEAHARDIVAYLHTLR
jgi:cytochrome c2